VALLIYASETAFPLLRAGERTRLQSGKACHLKSQIDVRGGLSTGLQVAHQTFKPQSKADHYDFPTCRRKLQNPASLTPVISEHKRPRAHGIR
jgi:hypothetical protein